MPSPASRWLRLALGSRRSLSDRARQRNGERRPGAAPRADGEQSPHLLDDLARDVQPEPRTADAARHLRIEAVELLEDPALFGRRDAEALVRDVDAHPVGSIDDAQLDPAPVGRALDGVL